MLINYESKSSLETLSAADLRASLAAYYGTRADDMEDSSEVFVSVHAFFSSVARHSGVHSPSMRFLLWNPGDATLSVHQSQSTSHFVCILSRYLRLNYSRKASAASAEMTAVLRPPPFTTSSSSSSFSPPWTSTNPRRSARKTTWPLCSCSL